MKNIKNTFCYDAWKKFELEDISSTSQLISKVNPFEARLIVNLKKVEIEGDDRATFSVTFSVGSEKKVVSFSEHKHEPSNELFEPPIRSSVDKLNIVVSKKKLQEKVITTFVVDLDDLVGTEFEQKKDGVLIKIHYDFQQIKRSKISGSLENQKENSYHGLFSALVKKKNSVL